MILFHYFRPHYHNILLGFSRYTWCCWDYVNSVTISLGPGDNGRGSQRLVINFTRQSPSPALCSRHERHFLIISCTIISHTNSYMRFEELSIAPLKSLKFSATYSLYRLPSCQYKPSITIESWINSYYKNGKIKIMAHMIWIGLKIMTGLSSREKTFGLYISLPLLMMLCMMDEPIIYLSSFFICRHFLFVSNFFLKMQSFM